MIAYLAGKILRKTPDSVILDTGGVGYRIHLNSMTHEQLGEEGQEVQLEVHTVVREDEISLYGFLEYAECRMFAYLLGASGVGPKMAMTILANCPWRDLILAIQREDVSRLRAIKGIGEKTAKLIVLGLKNKLKEFEPWLKTKGFSSMQEKSKKDQLLYQDIEAALLSLGYSRLDVQRTIPQLPQSEKRDLSQMIKESLQILSGGVR